MTSSGQTMGLADGQRVLAAIVFTDISAYSARMHHNEAHTIQLVDRDLALITEICTQHGGQVLKHTGDGLLLFFNSAQAAMATALEAQQKLAEQTAKLPPQECLLHRIGIHLGDVYVRGQDVMGDGVNVAQRLLGEAEPGGICFSQTVYDVIKNRMEVKATYLGPRELKNISEAVPVYLVRVFSPLQSTLIEAVTESLLPASSRKKNNKQGSGVGAWAAAAVVSSLLLGGLAVWLALRGNAAQNGSGGIPGPAVAVSHPTQQAVLTPPAPPTGTAMPVITPSTERRLPTSKPAAPAFGRLSNLPPLPIRKVLPFLRPNLGGPASQPASQPVPASMPTVLTVRHIQSVYAALQRYATAHNGQFPPDKKAFVAFDASTPPPLLSGSPWEGLDFEKAFAYEPGFCTNDPEYVVLGYRVAKDEQGQRLVLFLNGQIRLQKTDQLRRALEHNARYRQQSKSTTQPK